MKLDNGLVIQKVGTIFIKSAVYKMFWSHTKPARNKWYAASYLVDRQIETYSRTLTLNNTNWFSRFEHIRELLLQSPSQIQPQTRPHDTFIPGRVKRGWFNIIGKGARFLFGTAMQSDVDKVKRNIASLQKSEEQTRHYANKLASFVNTNIKQIRTITGKYLAFEKYIFSLKETFNTHIISELNNMREAIKTIAANDQINSLLNAFETFTLLQLQHEDAFKNAKTYIELGRLTESLWPSSAFREIVLPNPLIFAPDTWYYRNIRVNPLTISNNQIIWYAELPLITTTVFDQYNIITAAVPIGKRSVQIVLPHILGFDVRNQVVIQPALCQGEQDKICDDQKGIGAL
jgi:hypothetical protein